MPRSTPSLTPEQRAELRRIYLEIRARLGLAPGERVLPTELRERGIPSLAEMARQAGVPPQALYNAIYDHRAPRIASTHERGEHSFIDRAALVATYQETGSVSATARAHGTTRGTVYYWLRRAGVATRRAPEMGREG